MSLHVDIVGPLPPSQRYTYLFTCIDRYTRWSEAVPMVDATAESCARALLSGRVARFGVPLTITSDQGLVDVANTADEEDNFDIEKDLPNFFEQ